MLQVVCVKVGEKYSAHYVNVLFDMVRRNLQVGAPGQFCCLTDDAAGLDPAIRVLRVLPELGARGWWAKLQLFHPKAFSPGDRVVYFDLDTVVTGPLDQIVSYSGPFAILRDAYRPDGLQSSVMAWEAGNWTRTFWEAWDAAGRPGMEGGDQALIEGVLGSHKLPPPEILQELYPGRLRSYKAECRAALPRGTSVVFFHGEPRPHQVDYGWVPECWKIGGGCGLEWIVQSNTPDEDLRRNVRYALDKPRTWLRAVDQPHAGVAIIVGGGPSLAQDLYWVRGLQMSGAKVFALNNSWAYLEGEGIHADAHVMLDARADNLPFVAQAGVPKYYASQCHPQVLDAAGADLICWHAHGAVYHDMLRDHIGGAIEVGGGTTVGMKAIALAYILGFREFRLMGFDSCYEGDAHHAYAQPLNDGARILDVYVNGEAFKCAPWMISQAEEFKDLAALLMQEGCTLHVHGQGLIPTLARLLGGPPAAELRARQMLEWIGYRQNPIGVEVGVYRGDLSARLLAHPTLVLYMVDSWTVADPGSPYAATADFHAALSQEEQDGYALEAERRVAFAGKRAQIMRASSIEAASCFAAGSLDFVFLDADHSFEGVSADLAAWLPKLKPDGFLCGHDYANPVLPDNGVKRAVDELLGIPSIGENYTWRIDASQLGAKKHGQLGSA